MLLHDYPQNFMTKEKTNKHFPVKLSDKLEKPKPLPLHVSIVAAGIKNLGE